MELEISMRRNLDSDREGYIVENAERRFVSIEPGKSIILTATEKGNGFSIQELIVPRIYEHADFEYDYDIKIANFKDPDIEPRTLSPIEANIFDVITKLPNHVTTYEAIFRAGWPHQAENTPNYIRLYIKYLNNKLSVNPADKIIKNIPKTGYVLLDKSKPGYEMVQRAIQNRKEENQRRQKK